MKKLVLLFFTFNCFAQAPSISWEKTYGGIKFENANALKKTNDGGYIIAGYSTTGFGGSSNFNQMGQDWWVMKIDSLGAVIWEKTYGGTGDELLFSINPTADGGYIMSGHTGSSNGDVTSNHGMNDIWVVKIDGIGTIQWQKTIGGSNFEISGDAVQCADGGYLVCGSTRSHDGDAVLNPAGFDDNSYIIKLDSFGVIQWQKFYGGTLADALKKIVEVNDGFVLCGMTTSNDINVSGNHGGFDYWIVKIDSLGNLLWQKTLGGTLNDSAMDIEKTNDDGFIVAGYSYSTNGNITGNHGDDDAWIVKLSSDGNIQWQRAYGGTNTDRASDISVTRDGYAFAGYSLSTDGDVTSSVAGYQGWVVKIDSAGNLTWNKTLGGSSSESMNGIVEITGGYVVAGYTSSANGDVTINHGQGDMWVVKLAQQDLSNNPTITIQFSVFPNPAKSFLNLQMSKDIFIDKVTITDLTGKIIIQQTKNNNVINTENLSGGIYFIHAFSGENKYQTKFIKE
ncbi:MAG: T9SS type A sorting domain-containing protein [Flavobacterium sp. JAD_PAG50586_2]|nr:MAG: T9SS type A sorting domain-containing protein [Flavobacterium sp. JAD_PAG50586_2]